ncbi:Ger(x)C family spore germination protein [Heliobacterium undosum]|uniref:Ger(X)C family spore germination protein n=1 Tax=Heliomicrobium undosum TaxID=121734 RepID=A0A845L5L3_9FIRM|nr:Ger(x)C family spore germination protein [Heliomicrobium undosum]MZP28221.1 Ger(x)C family spore germination protein [Heliomicrobium undosum]
MGISKPRRGLGMLHVLLLAVLLSPLVAGCGEKQELDRVAFIIAVGIDKVEEGRCQLTAQFFKAPARIGVESEKMNPFWLITVEGESMMDASLKLRRRVDGPISWHQARTYIIGEEAAKEDMKDIVDFLVRNIEVRKGANMAIAEGSARDYMVLAPEFEMNIAQETWRMIENYREWGGTTRLRMGELILASYEPQTGVLFPYLRKDKPTPVESMKGKKEEKLESYAVPAVSGGAMVRDFRMRGQLNEEETRGYLLVRAKEKAVAPVLLDCMDEEAVGQATVVLSSIRRRIEMHDNGGIPAFRIEITASGKLMEYHCETPLVKDRVKQLEAMTSEKARHYVLAAWNQAQQSETDLFGFSRELKAFYPEIWRKEKEQWSQRLREITLDVNVNVRLSNVGTIDKGVISENQKAKQGDER